MQADVTELDNTSCADAYAQRIEVERIYIEQSEARESSSEEALLEIRGHPRGHGYERKEGGA